METLVRAGFFYIGIKTIVTCFYCNGSLQNWGPNDNPMIEHARWFHIHSFRLILLSGGKIPGRMSLKAKEKRFFCKKT
jgi:hypothetical protein